MSPPLVPHTLPTVMRLSTAPWVTVWSRDGKTGLLHREGEVGAKQSDQGRSSGNNHDQPQSNDVQARPKWQARPEVSRDLKPLQSKARHNRHLTQLRQELRPRDRASTLLLGHQVMEGPEEAGQGNDSPCTPVPDHHHEGKPRNSVTPWLGKHF